MLIKNNQARSTDSLLPRLVHVIRNVVLPYKLLLYTTRELEWADKLYLKTAIIGKQTNINFYGREKLKKWEEDLGENKNFRI